MENYEKSHQHLRISNEFNLIGLNDLQKLHRGSPSPLAAVVQLVHFPHFFKKSTIWKIMKNPIITSEFEIYLI